MEEFELKTKKAQLLEIALYLQREINNIDKQLVIIEGKKQ